MPTLLVTTRDGVEHSVEGMIGVSVMEALRDEGIDELLALCGGCCSCAACHIYVDEAFDSRTPVMSADEDDLLESSSHRLSNSRLPCQIPLSGELDGMRIEIAPEE